MARPLISHVPAGAASGLGMVSVADMGPQANLQDASVAWKCCADGKFSVSSAYQVRAGQVAGGEDKVWKVIHGYRGLRRIRIFLWLVCSHRLIVRVALAPISLFLMESRLHSSGKHVENNENEDGFEKSFKEMISTLPTTKSWRSSENLFQYQGFWLHPAYLKGVVSAQQQFQAQPTDIMLCNLPKTGTTWLKSLIFSIITRASFQDSLSPLLSKTPHEVVPFMELDHAHFPLTETSDFQCWLRMFLILPCPDQ
ncbi:hypothetical protein V6N11_008226 [Hibiscus sabdariffa]|uniref:Sulfotransferase n=1 Tax=Hibiscus sabdariffa TaxID=183260 RepID=A0ABR2Q017_9ROSI